MFERSSGDENERTSAVSAHFIPALRSIIILRHRSQLQRKLQLLAVPCVWGRDENAVNRVLFKSDQRGPADAGQDLEIEDLLAAGFEFPLPTSGSPCVPMFASMTVV